MEHEKRRPREFWQKECQGCPGLLRFEDVGSEPDVTVYCQFEECIKVEKVS